MPNVELHPQVQNVISTWYPWVTNQESDILDRNLNRKVSRADLVALSGPEILTVLRWFECVPDGFRSGNDLIVVSLLEEKLAQYPSCNN